MGQGQCSTSFVMDFLFLEFTITLVVKSQILNLHHDRGPNCNF